jgi:hypothetical protein
MVVLMVLGVWLLAGLLFAVVVWPRMARRLDEESAAPVTDLRAPRPRRAATTVGAEAPLEEGALRR